MESSDSVAGDTPGARLRSAREAMGVSPREMADRLNWLPAHVAAIEEDRFDELRGAAFVRGYLRAYARALNLDEDEIVAGYAAMHPEQEATPAPAPAPSSVAATGQKTGWSVLFGVVVSIAIIAGIWWKQQSAAPVKPAAQAQTASAPAAVPEASPPVAPEPSRPDASTGLVAEAPSEAAPAESAAIAPAETRADSGEAPAITSEPAADIAESLVAENESAAPGAAKDVLEFEFSDDCWLEVRDGDDQLIYADLHGPGDRIAIEGKPPFRILAGNAAALSLSFRGEPVPVITRPGRDSARFTVGR